ncbi:neuraminidase-like domain-containing protein [Pseudomonas chlororaphis]|uniref:Tc toxin subunit A-related protein n=1 Tax=Pseudomonas chlororaphis TaxID=587753 RepID=UPI00352AB133
MSNYTETYNLLMESRRNAYVPAYITYCIPDTKVNGVPLNETVKTVNELYEYLLIDPLNSVQVDTTIIGETISSLQMYINRCISGYEPEVDNERISTMVDQSRPGGFLYDWKAYNQAYSSWSAKERLQYYASNYISPELRQNKTTLFEGLAQSISQGKMNTAKTEQAFTDYVAGFETLANLQTISGYLVGYNASEFTEDKVYFVGRTNNQPCKYYLRYCDMSLRNEEGKISSTAWSQWEEIAAPITSPLNDFVSCAWFNSRCNVAWISSAITGRSGDSPEVSCMINIYSQNSNKSWSSYRQITPPPLSDSFIASRVWCAGDNFVSYSLFFEAVDPNGQTKLFVSISEGNWIELTGSAKNIPNGFVFCDAGYSTPIVTQAGEKFLVSRSICEVLEFNKTTHKIRIGTTLEHLTYTLISYMGNSMGTRTASATESSVLLDYAGDGVYLGHQAERIKIQNSDNPNFLLWTSLPSNPAFYTNSYFTEYFSAPYLNFSDYLLNLKPLNGEEIPLAQISTNSGPIFFAALESGGIGRLLSYSLQEGNVETPDGPAGATAPINFNSAYGLYFWELFFYIPFLIANRYLVQQDYDNAAVWYQYIFSNAGYRNPDGELETIAGKVRYWNVVPLQQDLAWNEVIPPTLDPNAIAMNDPMQFKMGIFLKTVEMLIQSGDHYYRQLDREALTRARMYYLEAAELLGPRPTIDYNNSWPDPTLEEEAKQLLVFNVDDPDPTSPNWMCYALLAWLENQNGSFLPPYNEDLLRCWDTLDIRFYNLRHNLSLNGQPLLLPMYAEPLSPVELQLRSSAGTGPGSNTMQQTLFDSQFRFQVLLEQARIAAGNVVQFGASLLSTLEKGNNTTMALLLQTQQKSVLMQTQSIQNTNLAIQQNILHSMEKLKQAAQARWDYYQKLCDGGLSGNERSAFTVSAEAALMTSVSTPLFTVGAVVSELPTIFGLADGGSQPGIGLLNAAFAFQAVGQSLQMTSGILEQTASYARRSEEWAMQRDNSKYEVEQIDAQIAAQSQQIEMAKKQITLNQLERTNQEEVYTFLRTSFTGQPLYNWMTARLSALYYQLYDVTLELCLTAKRALVREVGEKNAGLLFTAPIWNDLYQGLLAGEGLLVELQRMENDWLQFNSRGLEIQRTISLNTLSVESTPSQSLSSAIGLALASPGSTQPPGSNSSVSVVYQSAGVLRIELDIAPLELSNACNSTDRIGRFYSISVTLPSLLGPYQDVNATLEYAGESGVITSGTTIAVSRGLDDMGIFISGDNSRYLPFEGIPTNRGKLILNFYQVGPGEQQRTLVERLVDVIYQVRYTLKDE